MSWFGLGGGEKKQESKYQESQFPESNFDNTQQFSAPSNSVSSNPGQSGLEQQLMMAQQQVMVQQLVFRLTETAFESCVSKPSTSLSSSEQSCMSAVVNKYLDATEFMMAKQSR